MNQPRYEIRSSTDSLHYVFFSEEPKGRIPKLVDYAYLDDMAVWNLGFGDYNVNTGRVDDRVVSDNGDGRKVLATVVATLLRFFEQYPEETVLFTGSTAIRTRVYGRIITLCYSELVPEN